MQYNFQAFPAKATWQKFGGFQFKGSGYGEEERFHETEGENSSVNLIEFQQTLEWKDRKRSHSTHTADGRASSPAKCFSATKLCKFGWRTTLILAFRSYYLGQRVTMMTKGNNYRHSRWRQCLGYEELLPSETLTKGVIKVWQSNCK